MITSFDTLSVMTQKDFGIIGIAATGSILNPTNNKQGFVSNTDTYEAVEQWIKECFHDYKQQNTGEEVHGKIQPKTGATVRLPSVPAAAGRLACGADLVPLRRGSGRGERLGGVRVLRQVAPAAAGSGGAP
mmetsp:Transcript_24898/g.62634  ORF Transcript_24898/g.62634 Transcript_24898/m.62634 type:complete len:131 (-) Transcript_24898:662-1054(-)